MTLASTAEHFLVSRDFLVIPQRVLDRRLDNIASTPNYTLRRQRTRG